MEQDVQHKHEAKKVSSLLFRADTRIHNRETTLVMRLNGIIPDKITTVLAPRQVLVATWHMGLLEGSWRHILWWPEMTCEKLLSLTGSPPSEYISVAIPRSNGL